MAVTQGLPSAADLLTITDKLASVLKAQYANIGIGAPGESGTLAAKAILARDDILGDGTTANPGLANAALQTQLLAPLQTFVGASRYDVFFSQLRQIFSTLDSYILSNLPAGWTFSVSPAQRATDLWLTYLNANNTNVPAAPANAMTVTAATGGSIPTVASGSAPRIVVAHASSANSAIVSQPSAPTTQVALTGSSNAYQVAFTGTASYTGYLNVYRQLLNNGGSGDPYYYDQRIAVTSGQAIPNVTLTNSDIQLRQDILPPVWIGCQLLPEAAALFALAFAAAQSSSGAQGTLMAFTDQAFASPGNVALNPVSGYAGINNPASTMQFGQWSAGTYTAGTIQTSNVSAQALQGFSGAAGGVQARVTSALDANASLSSITYKYYDAAHPTALQTGTVAGPLTLNLAVGQTVDLGITAGRLVTQITAVTTGVSTTGAYIFEAKALRSI